MGNRVEYEFDPFEIAKVDKSQLSPTTVKQVLSDVKNYVLESVLQDAGSQRSSATGAQWKGLSPGYKKRKAAIGGSPIANLELSGDMLGSLRILQRGASTLNLTVGANEQDKADGHCNHSGQSSLPLRRFVPLDEGFRAGIERGIVDIVKFAEEAESPTESLASKTTLTALQDLIDSELSVTLKRENK